jgi:dihydroorotate dehydrogenase
LLTALLRGVHDENKARKPILVKIAPDLSPADLANIIAVCAENEVAGIIATNTTINHAAIPLDRDQNGGLSGAPLRNSSTAFIRTIVSQSQIPVIGCGGITNAASALEKIDAGASLVQIYTGLIYRGPGLLREIGAAFAARKSTN